MKTGSTSDQNSKIEYVSFSDFVKKRKIQQAKANNARNKNNEKVLKDFIYDDIALNDSIEDNYDDEYPFKV